MALYVRSCKCTQWVTNLPRSLCVCHYFARM